MEDIREEKAFELIHEAGSYSALALLIALGRLCSVLSFRGFFPLHAYHIDILQ